MRLGQGHLAVGQRTVAGRHHGTARQHASGPDHSAGPDHGAATVDRAGNHSASSARFAAAVRCRCARSGQRVGAGRPVVLARSVERERPLHRTSRRSVQPVARSGPGASRVPGWLRADDREVPAEQHRQPARSGADARVRDATDGRREELGSHAGMHGRRGFRHQRHAAQRACRLCHRGHPVVHAVQSQQPGPVLQQEDLPRGRA